jgi:hypothetical protein
MKSLLLVMFVFVSSIAFAQEVPVNYEGKVQALIAAKQFDQVEPVLSEWQEKSPDEPMISIYRSQVNKLSMDQAFQKMKEEDEAEEKAESAQEPASAPAQAAQ